MKTKGGISSSLPALKSGGLPTINVHGHAFDAYGFGLGWMNINSRWSERWSWRWRYLDWSGWMDGWMGIEYQDILICNVIWLEVRVELWFEKLAENEGEGEKKSWYLDG